MKCILFPMVLFSAPFWAFAQSPELNTRIEQLAAKYEVSAPLAREIIRCESQFNPYAKGPTNDHGYFQFVPKYWKKELLAQDLDMFVPEDNLEAGFYVLSKYGTAPWRASRRCWIRATDVSYSTKKSWVLPSGLVVRL